MSTSPDGLACVVKKLRSRSALDAAAEEAILGLPHVKRTVFPNDYLLREGDRADQCSVILSGFAFRHKLTGFGARQILSIHIPGDILDLSCLFLETADHNIQMLTGGEVLFIPEAALAKLALSNPAIARAMWIDSLIDSAIFREWIVNVGRRDGRARIAHLLCEFAVRFGAAGLSNDDGNCYELPMTQEQLADAAGLTPVHVNRTLKSLTAAGLISRDRRYVTIENWEALAAVADFCSRYLHVAAVRGNQTVAM